MERVAARVADRLVDEVGEESLVGVSYYTEEEIGHVYRSEWAASKYTADQIDRIVQELKFEALGHGVHEERQMESLHATVRVYEELLDVLVPVTDAAGVAYALDTAGEYRLRNAVEAAEAAIEASAVERTAVE